MSPPRFPQHKSLPASAITLGPLPGHHPGHTSPEAWHPWVPTEQGNMVPGSGQACPTLAPAPGGHGVGMAFLTWNQDLPQCPQEAFFSAYPQPNSIPGPHTEPEATPFLPLPCSPVPLFPCGPSPWPHAHTLTPAAWGVCPTCPCEGDPWQRGSCCLVAGAWQAPSGRERTCVSAVG